MNNQIFNSKGTEIEITAIHPGEILLDEIESRELVKREFAKLIGIFPNNLSLIFAGKRDISAPLAIKIGKVLGTGGEMWYNMQSAYNFQQAMIYELEHA